MHTHTLIFDKRARGASQVVLAVKNLPANEDTCIQSLGQENPPEKKMTTYFSILVWKNPMDRGTWRATVPGASKSWTQLSNWAHTHTKSNSVENHSLLTYGTGTIGYPQSKKKKRKMNSNQYVKNNLKSITYI